MCSWPCLIDRLLFSREWLLSVDEVRKISCTLRSTIIRYVRLCCFCTIGFEPDVKWELEENTYEMLTPCSLPIRSLSYVSLNPFLRRIEALVMLSVAVSTVSLAPWPPLSLFTLQPRSKVLYMPRRLFSFSPPF